MILFDKLDKLSEQDLLKYNIKISIKKETLKLILIQDILYELTKEGIFSYNLGILSVFVFKENDEIDVDNSLINLYKKDYHKTHPEIYNLLIDFKESNIEEHEFIQLLQKEIFKNKDYYTNFKKIKKKNYIKYIEYYQNPNFLDFFIYKNHYLIAYDYSQLYVFDIETNNIVYSNKNIGREIKYYNIFKYNNEEYLTTLYDDNEGYNKILIWKEDELKNKIEEILKTGIKILDRQYNVDIKRKKNIINEGLDYEECQIMVRCLSQIEFVEKNKKNYDIITIKLNNLINQTFPN